MTMIPEYHTIKLYKQCTLKSGNSIMNCWLEANKVKVGIKVTLKDSDNPQCWWLITSIGETILPQKDIKGSHDSGSWFDGDFHGKLNGLKY